MIRVDTEKMAVVETISPHDLMYEQELEVYLQVGSEALDRIQTAISVAGVETPKRILDFGCGHGRVLRMLRAAFPEAELTACDIDREAVDFCANTFGAVPMYSSTDTQEIPLEGDFDLIWSGSLFTHVDQPVWDDFLALLDSILSPGGLLVFTTAGRHVIEEMRQGERIGDLTDDQAHRLVSDFDRTGFGFQDYPKQQGYGLARAEPQWVCERLARHPRLRLIGFIEHGWAKRQDVVACQKERGAGGDLL